jgi:hypothetical protein
MKALGVMLIIVLTVPGLARAQGGQQITGSGGATAVGGRNTVSGSTLQGASSGLGNAANTAAQGLTGRNLNVNANTNQNATGVYIGSSIGGGAAGSGGAEGYVGTTFASPEQYIGFGDSTSVNLPQLPGFFPVPPNFSQPYKPDTWINGPGFIIPSTLTSAQADDCRSSRVSSSWDGGSKPDTESIDLVWPTLGQPFPRLTSVASYVGTSKVKATEKYSFMAAVCEAAYRAMRHGATKGIVNFVIRPKNKQFGIGFGASGGGTGFPASVASAHPYALAGVLGFGTGISSAHIEGELNIHITGLRESPRTEALKTEPGKAAGTPPPGNSGVEQDRQPVQTDADTNRPYAAEKAWFGRSGTQ